MSPSRYAAKPPSHTLKAVQLYTSPDIARTATSPPQSGKAYTNEHQRDRLTRINPLHPIWKLVGLSEIIASLPRIDDFRMRIHTRDARHPTQAAESHQHTYE